MKNKKMEGPERKLGALEQAVGECASEMFMEEVNAAIDSVPPDALKDVNLDRWFWQTLSSNTKQPRRARRPLPRRTIGIAACVAALVLISVSLWQMALKPGLDHLTVELAPGEWIEKQLLPNVWMRASIDAVAATDVPASVRIESVTPDYEAVKELLMPGQQPTEEHSGTNSNGSHDRTAIYLNGDDAYTYIYTDVGRVQFWTQNGMRLESIARTIDSLYDGAQGTGDNDVRFERALELENLPFMSREQADRLAQEWLLALGGEADVRLSRVYALDKTRLQLFSGSDWPDWGDEDACYVLEYGMEAFGMPLASDTAYRSDKSDYQTYSALAVISARGFEYLRVDGLFSILEAEEPAPVLTADAALALFVAKLRDDPPKQALVLKKVELRYLRIYYLSGDALEPYLVPVWRFLTPDSDPHNANGYNWTRFNAVTGKEE